MELKLLVFLLFLSCGLINAIKVFVMRLQFKNELTVRSCRSVIEEDVSTENRLILRIDAGSTER